MLFTADHDEPRRILQKFIAAEINPHVDEWEEAGIFPAHELFKKLGSLGFLGLNKPIEFGGQGLGSTIKMFRGMGVPPAAAALAAFIELLGGCGCIRERRGALDGAGSSGEPSEPTRLDVGPADEGPRILEVRVLVVEVLVEELQHAVKRGQWRAQLVRCGGDERPPCLLLLAQPLLHQRQRPGEIADLIVFIRSRRPVTEMPALPAEISDDVLAELRARDAALADGAELRA